MKAAILAYYDKKKITMPITDQFNNDFKSGKVRIKMDDASVVIEQLKKAKSCAVLVYGTAFCDFIK